MLSLLDPLELEDLVVFRDDEDPRKFYLLPDQPVIPLNDEGVPDFLFIKYLRDAEEAADAPAGGGWVQFRCTLQIDPARRQRVLAALRIRLAEEQAAGRRPFGVEITSTEPLLAAPLWTDGKVTLATFSVGEQGLVHHATGPAPADLAGDLGASFGLELSPDGAEIFSSAFKNWKTQQIPILIGYELTYKARVSARMEIHAKRQLVHQRIVEQARPYRLLALPFLRYVPIATAQPFKLAHLATLRASSVEPVAAMVPRQEVKQALRKAISTNEIEVRIRTDEAGGGLQADKVRELMFTLATELLTDRVIPALFGESPGLPGAESESDTRAGRELMEVRDDPQDHSASFDFTLDHQSTVDRKVNPNGSVQLLLRNESVLGSAFRELRLADGFFKRMQVAASTAGVNFEQDGIDKVHVFYRYEERDEAAADKPWVRRHHDLVLGSAQDTGFWRFDCARDAGGRHKQAYRYGTRVYYRQGPPDPPGDGTENIEFRTSSARRLLISPRAMGALRVEAALTAPKDLVASAEVALRYVGPTGRTFEQRLLLTPEANRRTWFQYTGGMPAGADELAPPEYTYEVAYRTHGGVVRSGPRRSTDQLLEIASPFARTLGFTVRPQGSFDGVAAISGDLVYEDAAQGYALRRSFELAKLSDEAWLEIPILPSGPETARWSARVVRQDGSVLELSGQNVAPGTVWVGESGGVLSVEVVPDLIDFEHDVQLAVVELSYEDAAHAIARRATFRFSKADKAAKTWKVDRRDPQWGRYAAVIQYIAYDRSKSSTVRLQDVDDQVLVLDRAPAAPVP